MYNLNIPQFASVSQLQRKYTKLLKLVKEKKTPLYLLRKNKVEVVMLDIQLYEEILKLLKKMEENLALEAINTYFTEKKKGKLKKMKNTEELFR